MIDYGGRSWPLLVPASVFFLFWTLGLQSDVENLRMELNHLKESQDLRIH